MIDYEEFEEMIHQLELRQKPLTIKIDEYVPKVEFKKIPPCVTSTKREYILTYKWSSITKHSEETRWIFEEAI